MVVLFGTSDDKKEGDDLFDYFDPLRSPHDYPNGIPSSSSWKNDNNQKKEDDDWTPMKFQTVPDDFQGANTADYNIQKQQQDIFANNQVSTTPIQQHIQDNNNNKEGDIFEFFDPRISPHLYPNGIPSASSASSTPTQQSVTIGIVLMDHGSRKPSSNQALQQLADSYQQYLNSPTIVVKGAHMEIAQPSIPTTLQQLVSTYPNIHTILCHPYFLSSEGKHVTQDIPQIIQDAKRIINNDKVSIITTQTTGSDHTTMIPLIDSIVQSNLQQHQQQLPQKQKLGGIFADIQRMLEEQD